MGIMDIPLEYWILLTIAGFLISLSAFLLWIVWKNVKRENLLAPILEDLGKIPILNGKVSDLSGRTQKILERMIELGISTSASASVRMALQHPMVIKLLKEMFPILPLVADLAFNHFKGNVTKFMRALLTKFEEHEGTIDLLVEDLDAEDYEEIKRTSLDVIEEAGKIVGEAAEQIKDEELRKLQTSLDKLGEPNEENNIGE
jgi:hypothetical protein